MSGFDMDDVPAAGNSNDRKPRDVVELYKLPDKKFVRLRIFGSVFPYGGHWVKTKTKDNKDTKFYRVCAAFDLTTGRMDSTKSCAFCNDKSGNVQTSIEYYANVIHRSEQKNAPESIKTTKEEAESGFKDKESESWTPVKALRLSRSLFQKVQSIKQLNVHENDDGDNVGYPVTHPKLGIDINIKHDKDLPPANQYEAQMGKGDASPLTKVELKYLKWDLSELMITPTEEDTDAEYKKWATRMGIAGGDEEQPKKKKKALEEFEDDEPAPKAKKKPAADDFDDEDEAPKPKAKNKVVDDFDDEDDEPAPKVKKKPSVDEEDEPAPKPKKKPVADDFDDEDDEPAPKAKKKPVVEEEEDEDDEPAPKPKAKKKVVDDFDDEDEPAPKAKAKKKPAADDFDEDDEPAPKPKAKKKPVVSDDEDDIAF